MLLADAGVGLGDVVGLDTLAELLAHALQVVSRRVHQRGQALLGRTHTRCNHNQPNQEKVPRSLMRPYTRSRTPITQPPGRVKATPVSHSPRQPRQRTLDPVHSASDILGTSGGRVPHGGGAVGGGLRRHADHVTDLLAGLV